MCEPTAWAAVAAAVIGGAGSAIAANQNKPNLKLPDPIKPPEPPQEGVEKVDQRPELVTAQQRAARAGTSQLRLPSGLGIAPGGRGAGSFLNLPK